MGKIFASSLIQSFDSVRWEKKQEVRTNKLSENEKVTLGKGMNIFLTKHKPSLDFLDSLTRNLYNREKKFSMHTGYHVWKWDMTNKAWGYEFRGEKWHENEKMDV